MSRFLIFKKSLLTSMTLLSFIVANLGKIKKKTKEFLIFFYYFFSTTVQFLSESLAWLNDVFTSLVRSCSSYTIFAVLCRLVSLLRGIQLSRFFCLHTVADEKKHFMREWKNFVGLHKSAHMISVVLTALFCLYRGRSHRFDTPLSDKNNKICRVEQSCNRFFIESALTCIR